MIQKLIKAFSVSLNFKVDSEHKKKEVYYKLPFFVNSKQPVPVVDNESFILRARKFKTTSLDVSAQLLLHNCKSRIQTGNYEI